jgi:hypothetical protein
VLSLVAPNATLVSVDSTGLYSGNSVSREPAVNFDGSIVAFASLSNLAAPNTTSN